MQIDGEYYEFDGMLQNFVCEILTNLWSVQSGIPAEYMFRSATSFGELFRSRGNPARVTPIVVEVCSLVRGGHIKGKSEAMYHWLISILGE